ncbi:tetracycline resistance MFS efflux pump, partial [bacterium M00.F.Ca.ET.180.01.1.1]
PRVIPRLGEWRTAVIGLTFTAASAFGYAFASQGWMVYAVIVVGCLEALADPPLRSLAAAKVPPSAQGELQGAMTSIFSITSIITPLLYTGIFSWFTGPNAPVVFGGAPYLLGAVFLTLAVI